MKRIMKKFTGLVLASGVVLGIVGCANPDSSGGKEPIVLEKIVPECVLVKGGTVTGAANSNMPKGVFIEGRTVVINDFYMGKYEVTEAQYKSIMYDQKVIVDGVKHSLNPNPSTCTCGSFSEGFKIDYKKDHSNHPVDLVTWYDALYYCNVLSEKEDLKPCYNIEIIGVNTNGNIIDAVVSLTNDGNGYRLPTEAEWEYAARGGDPEADDWNYIFSGSDCAEGLEYTAEKNSGVDNVGWYAFNNNTGSTAEEKQTATAEGSGTHNVGLKAPNRLGIYDMTGNVAEKCWDYYGTNDIAVTTPATVYATGDPRVVRGGSWATESAEFVTVTDRNAVGPAFRGTGIGFRVVRSAN